MALRWWLRSVHLLVLTLILCCAGLVTAQDNVPRFQQEHFSFAVYENEQIGTRIGVVEAVTPDPPHDSIIYSLQNLLDVFEINATSGMITTRQVLDRESIAVYNVTAVATNAVSQELNASVGVTIYVADRNDNSPRVLFPNNVNNTVLVPHSTPVGAMFTRVIAVDLDAGVDGQLVYSIQGGNEQGLFSINATTGALYVEAELEAVAGSSYALLIMVKDSSDFLPMSTMALLNVEVTAAVSTTRVTTTTVTAPRPTPEASKSLRNTSSGFMLPVTVMLVYYFTRA